MKRLSLFLLLFIISLSASYSQVKLYIGTYTDTESKGIYSAVLDTVNGQLSALKLEAEIENPSYLAFSADKKHLYAVQETQHYQETKSGALSAFSISNDGSLSLLNTVSTGGAHPCHIAVNPHSGLISVTNYTGGNVGLFSLLPDGSLSDLTQNLTHHGNGPDASRQESPHPHSSQFSQDGTRLYTADLGNDEFAVYQWQDKKFVESTKNTLKLPGGNGPRHFVQTADGRFIYVLNELSSTVSIIEKKDGKAEMTNEVSTLSPSFKGDNYSADIHLSADEQFLYISNRGENSIAVFKRTTEGALAYLGFVGTRGNWPRNFSLDPTGKFLLAANQLSDSIVVFKLGKNGIPVYVSSWEAPRPVCLLFE